MIASRKKYPVLSKIDYVEIIQSVHQVATSV